MVHDMFCETDAQASEVDADRFFAGKNSWHARIAEGRALLVWDCK
jgi:hypothetical protein